MQITSNEIFNIKYVQIYLTEEELKRKSTKEVIENYKKQKYKNRNTYKFMFRNIIVTITAYFGIERKLK